MTPRLHEPSRPHAPASPDDASEPLPGEPFLAPVCICRECERLLTASSSVARGTGPTCHAKERAESHYARLEAQGQLRMPWDAEVRAL